jgi:hypothetical protein
MRQRGGGGAAPGAPAGVTVLPRTPPGRERGFCWDGLRGLPCQHTPQRRRCNFVPHAFFLQKGVKAGPGVFVWR